jgi:hypothetical protein
MVETRVRVGRKVSTGSPKMYRVKCDLVFNDPRVALALRHIIQSFETSVQRMVRNGKDLG